MTKAERTRQLIIDKSAPLFNSKGIAGTSLSDILDATKLAKGSLYVHFENKEAISHAVVDHFVGKKLKFLEATLSRPGSAKEKLFAYLDVFLDPVSPPFEGGCPFLNFGMEADDLDQIIRKKVKKIIDIVQQRIADTFEEGRANGEFKANILPQEFAIKLYAMMEGAVMMTRISGNGNYMKVVAKLLKQEILES